MREVGWEAAVEAVRRMARRSFGLEVEGREEIEALIRSVLEEPRQLLGALEEGLVTEEEVAAAVAGHAYVWMVHAANLDWNDAGVPLDDPFVRELEHALFGRASRRWRARGPYHTFVPLPVSERARITELSDDSLGELVRVSDDVINYLWDSLEWIPSAPDWDNPAWPGRGLDHCGLTVIDATGAATAVRVFTAWADLFSAGPAQLELRCDIVVGADDQIEEGIAVVARGELVDQLRTIAGYFARCEGGAWFVLHRGI